MWEINICVHVVYEDVNVALVYFAITGVSPACSAFPSTISTSGKLSQVWHYHIRERTFEFRQTKNLKTLSFETYNTMRKYD